MVLIFLVIAFILTRVVLKLFMKLMGADSMLISVKAQLSIVATIFFTLMILFGGA